MLDNDSEIKVKMDIHLNFNIRVFNFFRKNPEKILSYKLYAEKYGNIELKKYFDIEDDSEIDEHDGDLIDVLEIRSGKNIELFIRLSEAKKYVTNSPKFGLIEMTFDEEEYSFDNKRDALAFLNSFE
jgi:hypothetical protein